MTTPAAKHAFMITIAITLIAVPANTIFGVTMAMAIVRRRFRGKGIVNALVDLPLALSPVVVGLAFLLLYGTGGWLADLAVRRRLRVPRDGAGDDLHLAAVRRARGRPRAA